MAIPEAILVDSNFFVALFNPNDTLYPRAVELSKILDAQRTSLVISSFIFLEVVTVLSQRRGREVAHEIGSFLLSNPLIRIIHISEALQDDTWSIFKTVRQKNMSFVDCSLLAVVRDEAIDTVLTFDRKDFVRFSKRYKFRLYP